MFTANRRTFGLLVLFVVVLFYAIGTGFPFFHRLLYVVLFLIAVGGVWAWLSLRGLELRVSRNGDRGQVGGYLEGRVIITNHTWMPKSWLEVTRWAALPSNPADEAFPWTASRCEAGASRRTWPAEGCSRADRCVW